MNANTDRIAHWFVSGLELEATVFHIGQYCGPWRASTAGRERASFHLVLRGHSWLHLDGQAPIRLGEREGVFLLRDIPHRLSPDADDTACRPCDMRPMTPAIAGACGLACGFFSFRGQLGELFRSALPDYVIIRADAPSQRAVGPLFELILAEAERHGEAGSPLIERLTELLFFYVIRDIAGSDEVAGGLLAVARRTEFAPVVHGLLREPGKDWSVDAMARLAHMSRASFCRHFADTCGQPPAQFLLQLRMKIAARRLQRGDSVLRAAEHVGYNSQAAFTRAFKRVIGEQPGAFQRARPSPTAHVPH